MHWKKVEDGLPRMFVPVIGYSQMGIMDYTFKTEHKVFDISRLKSKKDMWTHWKYGPTPPPKSRL